MGTDGQMCLSVPKFGTDKRPVTMVTTGHQIWPKMGQNSIISSFFPMGKKASAEGQSSSQELEVGPRSGPYFLVCIIRQFSIYLPWVTLLPVGCNPDLAQLMKLPQMSSFVSHGWAVSPGRAFWCCWIHFLWQNMIYIKYFCYLWIHEPWWFFMIVHDIPNLEFQTTNWGYSTTFVIGQLLSLEGLRATPAFF